MWLVWRSVKASSDITLIERMVSSPSSTLSWCGWGHKVPALWNGLLHWMLLHSQVSPSQTAKISTFFKRSQLRFLVWFGEMDCGWPLWMVCNGLTDSNNWLGQRRWLWWCFSPNTPSTQLSSQQSVNTTLREAPTVGVRSLKLTLSSSFPFKVG